MGGVLSTILVAATLAALAPVIHSGFSSKTATSLPAASQPVVQHTFASAPGNGCESEIEEASYTAVSESSAHQVAREKKEAIQQQCDKLLPVMREESAKCKAFALEDAPDPTAKSDCVRTENRLVASSEAVYKRLNASVKALNSVTKREMK